MNSKAIKRQLLAAIAMVLVAAIALGSSTYAWFVASGSVTAEGMKVQAQSEGGLAIRWAGETSDLWGTSASAKMTDAATLLPASTFDLKSWTYATAAAANNYAADKTTWEDVSADVMGADGKTYVTDNNYVVMQKFEIRSTSVDEPASGLFVSDVTVTRTNEKDIDSALRVGVRLVSDTNNVFYIYGPVPNATDGYTWTSGADKVTTKTVTLAQKGTAEDTNSQLVTKGTAIPNDKGTPIKVEIYIWYEGEDQKLYSDNYNANDLGVSVQFSSYGYTTA